MTAPEPTPLERAAASACNCGHGPGPFYDGASHSICMDDARAGAGALLSGDWLERVLAETSPCVWSIREENHPYGRACLDEHPDRHPGVGFCWVRPKKQATAIRAAAGVGL